MAEYDDNLDELTKEELEQLSGAFDNSEDDIDDSQEIEDLDNLLARLLDAEKEFDELEELNENIEESESDSLNNLLDEPSNEESIKYEQKENDNNKFKKIKSLYHNSDKLGKIIFLSIAIIFPIIILSGISLLFVFIFTAPRNYDSDYPIFLEIDNGNIIIPDLHSLQGQNIRINRLYLNTNGSMFQINLPGFTSSDFNNIEFNLNDNLGNIYQQIFPKRLSRASVAFIAFEALNPNASYFNLNIKNIITGEDIIFSYSFNSDLIIPPFAVYNSNLKYGVYLNSIFSNSHSQISLEFKRNGESIIFNENSSISLRNGGIFLTRLSHPEIIEKENSKLVNINFNSLNSLNSPLDIRLEGIYLHKNLNIIQNSAHMFIAGENRRTIFDINDYRLTIHGIQRQGNLFVMPLFGERIESNLETNETIRIPTNVEVYLIGYHLEEEIRIRGDVLYDERGTDVRFHISDDSRILNIPESQLYIKINSVYFSLSRMDFNLW